MKSNLTVGSRLNLNATYLAAIIVLMDLTAVNIALPGISRHFDLDMSRVSWLLMISMLSATSFALIAGKITEVWGTKKVLLIGFIIFMIGNLLSFYSRSFEALLIIRFFQGIGEALLYVAGPAFIRKNLSSQKQQSAYGIWMACSGIGIAFGPLIGATLISMFAWNWVFLVNLPLSIAGFLMIVFVKEVHEKEKEKKATDYWGAVYSFVFLAGLILGFNLMSRTNGNELLIYLSLFISVIFLFLFIRRENYFSNPVFKLQLFRIPNFRLTALGFFLYFLVNVGSRFLRPFYFENERMLSTETSGLLMMVAPLLMIFISPLSGRLIRLTSPKNLCVLGNVFLAMSMFMFAGWDTDTELWFIILSMIVLGIGMGVYYPNSSFVGMSGLPEQNSSMGSAAISTSKSLGKLMGVLVFVSLYTFFTTIAFDAFFIKTATRLTFMAGGIIALLAVVFSVRLKKT